MLNFQAGDALLIVDIQYDFFPGGALGVPEGDQIIPLVNEMIAEAKENNLPIYASRDWHPANHCSFTEFGGPWPVHCVQDSEGAALHRDVPLPEDTIVVNKAFDFDQEAYSAFEGLTDQDQQPIAELLRNQGVKRLWIGGLALDYCVKASALDAAKEGFDTHVILDATRAIATDKIEEVIDELKAAGVAVE